MSYLTSLSDECQYVHLVLKGKNGLTYKKRHIIEKIKDKYVIRPVFLWSQCKGNHYFLSDICITLYDLETDFMAPFF